MMMRRNPLDGRKEALVTIFGWREIEVPTLYADLSEIYRANVTD